MELSLRLYVLEKDDLEEMSFEEDVDESRSHLHNRYIKEESRAKDRQIDIIIHSGKTIILFVGQRLHELFIYSLLELPHILGRMLKDLPQFGIIPSLPLRIPDNLHHFILANEIAMHVLEMEDICPVLGDILNMALDIVDGPASVRISLAELLPIDHLKIRLHCWICMNPHINETVEFFCGVFTLLGVAAIFFPVWRLALFASEILAVFD